MFGLFKKKVPYVRYKILPYKESGFIVERHMGKRNVEELLDFIIMGETKRMFSSMNFLIVPASLVIFKTKEEARALIDDIMAEENQRKAAYNDKIRREEEHAKNNPPEWYP